MPSIRQSIQPRRLLALGAGILLCSIAVAARTGTTQGTPPDPAGSTPQTSDAKDATTQTDDELASAGEKLVAQVCNTSCHNLENVYAMRRTGREWSDLLITMSSKGATATDAELATIRKYLIRYNGLIAVNTATAEELSAVLGFSAADARAIVLYRTAHGKFADADALSKVPGIDKTKIDDQPDALHF